MADLTSLWIEFFVFPQDFASVRVGLPVRIRSPHSDVVIESKVSFVLRVVDERTQALVVRAVVDEKAGLLYPDQYVSAEILLETPSVPLAIKTTGVQRLGERTVVFVKTKAGYFPRDILIGPSDGETTEVLSGLDPGTEWLWGYYRGWRGTAVPPRTENYVLNFPGARR